MKLKLQAMGENELELFLFRLFCMGVNYSLDNGQLTPIEGFQRAMKALAEYK